MMGSTERDVGEEQIYVLETHQLKAVLFEATFAPNRAVKRNVRQIALGSIGDEGKRLMDLTLVDPQKREQGEILYITPDQRFLLPQEPTIGNSNGVGLSINIRFSNLNFYGLPKLFRQDRFVASHIHTHSNLDLPPSPQDLADLFATDELPQAATSIFVITHALKIIVFRGEKTPQLNQKEIKNKIALWNKLIHERVLQHLKPGMSDIEIISINARVEAALMRQIQRKYDIKFFICPIDRNVAILETI